MQTGEVLTLDVEKPAAGGRMLARHHGQVVLVSGTIPGERVRARVERVSSAVVFAETVEVQVSSEDRRWPSTDVHCGGAVLAHVAYQRQLQLKVEIVQDAFVRIARAPLTVSPAIVSSPERGYRMRARLHCRDGRLGFFREGTHDLCDAAMTGQLSDGAVAWMTQAERELSTTWRGLQSIELAENIAGDQRACHLELHAGVDPRTYAALSPGLRGLSARRSDAPGVTVLDGEPSVSDTFTAGEGGRSLTLTRDVKSFFQANRFLVQPLAEHVRQLVPEGPVVDLYAGVGLFGLFLAADGQHEVILVEGDSDSGADLQKNARASQTDARVQCSSVERFIASPALRNAADAGATTVIDPPRTGVSKEALGGIIEAAPRRIVYVSCDPATLARDTRRLVDAGYEPESVTLFDMFPNTAHVEAVVPFTAR